MAGGCDLEERSLLKTVLILFTYLPRPVLALSWAGGLGGVDMAGGGDSDGDSEGDVCWRRRRWCAV